MLLQLIWGDCLFLHVPYRLVWLMESQHLEYAA